MEYGWGLWESLGPRGAHEAVPFLIISIEFHLHLIGYIY